MPDHECPCSEMLRLRKRVKHLEDQTKADSDAMHTLHEECLEARKKCRCYEKGLIP